MKKLIVLMMSLIVILSGCNLLSDGVNEVVKQVDKTKGSKQLIDEIDTILGERESIYDKLRPALDKTVLKNLNKEYNATKRPSTAKKLSDENLKFQKNYEKRMNDLEGLKKRVLDLKKQPNANDPLAKKTIKNLVALLDKEIQADGVLSQIRASNVTFYGSLSRGEKPTPDNYQQLKQQQKKLEDQAKTALDAFNQAWDEFHFDVTGKHTIKKDQNSNRKSNQNSNNNPFNSSQNNNSNNNY